MQINSISPNFTGKRENIQAFINLDDATLQQAATLKTLQSIDTNKHRKLNKALYYALPASFGLSAAAKAAKGARLNALAYGTAGAALFLGGAGITWGLERLASKKSETYNKFRENHPVLAFLGSAAAAFGTGTLVLLGGGKAFDKAVSSKLFQNLAAKFNSTKFAGNLSKYTSQLTNYTGKKLSALPSALKEAGKWTAKQAPLAVILGTLLHSANHINTVNRTYAKNYTDLKEKQLNLAKRMNTELQVQNDFLLTKAENKEDLELIKNPTKDLPQEVLERLASVEEA